MSNNGSGTGNGQYVAQQQWSSPHLIVVFGKVWPWRSEWRFSRLLNMLIGTILVEKWEEWTSKGGKHLQENCLWEGLKLLQALWEDLKNVTS